MRPRYLCESDRKIFPSTEEEIQYASRVNKYLQENHQDKMMGPEFGLRYLFTDERLDLFSNFLLIRSIDDECDMQHFHLLIAEEHIRQRGGICSHPIIQSITAAVLLKGNKGIPFLTNYIADSIVIQPPFSEYMSQSLTVKTLLNMKNAIIPKMKQNGNQKASKEFLLSDWIALDFAPNAHLNSAYTGPEVPSELCSGCFFAYSQMSVRELHDYLGAIKHRDLGSQNAKMRIPAGATIEDQEGNTYLLTEDLYIPPLRADESHPHLSALFVGSPA